MTADTKYLLLTVAAILTGSLLSFCMTGCDGTFTADDYNKVVGATAGAYQTYDRSVHPQNYPQYPPPQPYYYHP